MIYDEKIVQDQRVLDVIAFLSSESEVKILSSESEVKMQFVDDRTDEQKKTHKLLVVATDKFLSGWGRAESGTSRCAWACEPHNVEKIYRWVKSRPEMKRVAIVTGKWRPNCAHAHVYVVTDNHPAVDGTYNID